MCVLTGYEHTGAIQIGVCSQTPPSILPGPADLHETLSRGNTVSHKSCPLPGGGTTPQGPANTSAYLGSLTTVKMYLIKMAIMDFAWSSSVASSPVRCQQTVVAVVTMAHFGCWAAFIRLHYWLGVSLAVLVWPGSMALHCRKLSQRPTTADGATELFIAAASLLPAVLLYYMSGCSLASRWKQRM